MNGYDFSRKVLFYVSRAVIVFALGTGTCLTAQALSWLENEPGGSVWLTSGKVWRIYLKFQTEQYQRMQPAPLPFGAPPLGVDDNRPASAPQGSTERNVFGVEFPWVEAECEVEGVLRKRVAVRYAGDITYLVSAMGLKRPLHIAFDRFGEQPLAGIRSLELQSSPLDPSGMRQVVAAHIFHGCGVPVPRVAFAEVYLSVPGRYDNEFLGLYTIVESVDVPFLGRYFPVSDGLLMSPLGVRGLEYHGMSWDRYQPLYRPRRPARPHEAQRVIDCARFIYESADDEFERNIGSYIDVESFIRFLAAHALASQLDSAFAIGYNYHLYLEPNSEKIYFLPGALEFSLGNFLLMGSPEQLMNLDVDRPYAGENRLVERLLAIPKVQRRYHALLQELLAGRCSAAALEGVVAELLALVQPIQARERAAAAARREPPVAIGAPGAGGPTPPDVRIFIRRRAESVQRQLAGLERGYRPSPPQFAGQPGAGLGPPGGARTLEPINAESFRAHVRGPADMTVTLFAAPPQVNYPVAIGAEPSGAIYVAVDEQGSLGRTPGGGKILRCVDEDHDGRVDRVTVFARVDHPRGVCYRGGAVWVMHPPTLSVFYDDNNDGIADRQEVLVTGLTTELIDIRGGDHTTNCVRMGIDGWLYIGVGDYGIKEAKGKDGRTIKLRGGGVVRVRPDGTELEIYCTGLRNPFDLAIDPYMNLFVRDNTNDGGGWDVRVSLLKQSALYGYPQLYQNFADEVLSPLGSFGAGGGTGGLYLNDERWPALYGNSLFTGDWGRNEVYHHTLLPRGASFQLEQEVFLTIPRPTGMDIDGLGRLFVGSWYQGEASVYLGPNVGFVVCVAPTGHRPEPFPDLTKASTRQLIDYLRSPRAVWRLHAQGELLRRGPNAMTSESLLALAGDSQASMEARVAALYTLKQLDGSRAHPALLELWRMGELREHVLRALTDRITQLEELPSAPFLESLRDASPRVRAQAAISIGRLNRPELAQHLLVLATPHAEGHLPEGMPAQYQPDVQGVAAHLAIQALVALQAHEACLAALDGPQRKQALRALRYMHASVVVDGLVKRLATAYDPQLRRDILVTLMRLYYREADYDGSWWGIRPDSTGPYYDPAEWQCSERIAAVLRTALHDSDPQTKLFLQQQLRRHRVPIGDFPEQLSGPSTDQEAPIVLAQPDPANPDQLGNMSTDEAIRRTLALQGDAQRGAGFFKAQSCSACHTTADGQTPKGPHLVDIGKRYNAQQLLESILTPSTKLAQGYETYTFVTQDGKLYTGFIVSESATSILIRESNGLPRELKRSDIEQTSRQLVSVMPEGIVANLTPQQLADLLAYLQSL